MYDRRYLNNFDMLHLVPITVILLPLCFSTYYSLLIIVRILLPFSIRSYSHPTKTWNTYSKYHIKIDFKTLLHLEI